MFEELAITVLAACLVGIPIKLMDDRLDAPADALAGRPNWSRRLGRADLAYALMAFAMATAISTSTATSLFMASYAVGMANSPHRRSPLAAPYWLESIVALTVGIAVAGLLPQTAALLAVVTVQLVDDERDVADKLWLQVGPLFGRHARWMAAGLTATGALYLGPGLLVGSLAAYTLNEVLAAQRSEDSCR